jgi:hypothetical protein
MVCGDMEFILNLMKNFQEIMLQNSPMQNLPKIYI